MLPSTFGRLCGAFLFVGLIATPIAPACAQALSYGPVDSVTPAYQTPDADEALTPALRRQIVDYAGNEPAGTIIVDPAHTSLYQRSEAAKRCATASAWVARVLSGQASRLSIGSPNGLIGSPRPR